MLGMEIFLVGIDSRVGLLAELPSAASIGTL